MPWIWTKYLKEMILKLIDDTDSPKNGFFLGIKLHGLRNSRTPAMNHSKCRWAFKDGDNSCCTYIKANMLKSYSGNISRPVTVQFFKNKPVKAHCSCPVGKSGLCWHAIALLIQLKFFHCHKISISTCPVLRGYRNGIQKDPLQIKRQHHKLSSST